MYQVVPDSKWGFGGRSPEALQVDLLSDADKLL